MNHRFWLLSLDKFEVILRFKVAINRNKYIKDIAKGYANNQAIPSDARYAHEARLKGILGNHYLKVIPYFARNTIRSLKSGDKIFEKKALSNFDSYVTEWASTEALKKARSIADTDTDDVLRVIQTGLLEGASIPEISKGIRKVTGLTPYRASVVARTETHNAATLASIESVRDVEEQSNTVFLKRWIPTNDPRTRDSHAVMLGSEAIGLDEPFIVDGESLDRPGDPSGSAGNIIHCRCQIIFEEKL